MDETHSKPGRNHSRDSRVLLTSCENPPQIVSYLLIGRVMRVL